MLSELLSTIPAQIDPIRSRHRRGRAGHPTAAVEPALLDGPGTAAPCAVSSPTRRRWVSAGRPPAPIKFGGRTVRWVRSELLAWIGAACPVRRQWDAQRR